MQLNRSLIAKAGAAALVVAAAGTASVAQARDNVYFSVGANVAPGVAISAGNAPYAYSPYYYGPRYYAPAPVVVATAPAPYYAGETAYTYFGPQFYDPAVGIQYYWHPQYHRYYYVDRGGRHHWR